jgi:hypothetical protein
MESQLMISKRDEEPCLFSLFVCLQLTVSCSLPFACPGIVLLTSISNAHGP